MYKLGEVKHPLIRGHLPGVGIDHTNDTGTHTSKIIVYDSTLEGAMTIADRIVELLNGDT